MDVKFLGFAGVNPAYGAQLLRDGTGAVPYGVAIRRLILQETRNEEISMGVLSHSLFSRLITRYSLA